MTSLPPGASNPFNGPVHQFLWLDLETTGLDPRDGVILEWAVVLAADDATGDMQPVEQYSGVIDPWPSTNAMLAALESMDPFVRNMHTNNGLLDAVAREGGPLAEAEDFLVELCKNLAGSDTPKGIVLAGATVHFDLAWIRVHMPRFAACLSHRVFDVSTLKLAAQSWAGQAFAKANAHRALADVLESLTQAREWRAKYFAASP